MVRKPVEGGAHGGVDGYIELLGLGSGDVDDPEFSSVRDSYRLAVVTPTGGAEFGVGWESDFDLGAVRQGFQGEGGVVGDEARAVGYGVDAVSGQTEHGLGEVSNSRVHYGVDQHDMGARGAERNRR